jgi:allophanate hydrolase
MCSMQIYPRGFTIAEWQQLYRQGTIRPSMLLGWATNGAAELVPDDVAWIARSTLEQLQAQLDRLEERLAAVGGDLNQLPLYGVPFAIKDNIDAAGWMTTVACPEFAYRAKEDAHVVARLMEAGAVLIGKTNLDQFATGLAGNRSPYGAVPNPFDGRYVSGGSSSGSASVVARGLVPFALGTDTAGSGRVPAGLNGIVGLKPTRGRLSTHGVVPACRTLDCVSVFALTVADAVQIAALAEGIDSRDPYSRESPATRSVAPELSRARLGVPASLEFFGDDAASEAFSRTLAALTQCGAKLVPIGYAPFEALARLLYEGPWVAERFLVVRELLEANPTALHPAVRQLVERARSFTAADAYEAEYARAALAREIGELLKGVDALVVPTVPIFYRLDEVEADPIASVMRMGHYTNFANLGDLCCLSIPGYSRPDGLPAGLTLLAPAWEDGVLAALASQWETQLAGALGTMLGATGRRLPPESVVTRSAESLGAVTQVAVVGAHLTGMPLNHQLTDRQGRLLEVTRTSAKYRLYALQETRPLKPGLVRDSA